MNGERILASEKDPDGGVELALSGRLLGKVEFCHLHPYVS